MGLLESFLGTSASIPSNPITAAAVTPSTSQINAVRSVSSTDGLTPVQTQVAGTMVTPIQGQPATTPSAAPSTNALPDDQYRNGIPEQVIDVDGINNVTLHKRQLDEYDEEIIATLSITKQISTQNAQQQIAGNVSNSVYSGEFDGDILSNYSRFFLTDVVEQQTEKYQVVETFTSFYVFFYGKRPSFYRYSGLLLNDPTHKWNNDLYFFYDNYFRGTRTVELGAEAVMTYDGRVVTGFIVGMTMQENSSNPKGVPFSIDFLVFDHFPVGFSTDITAFIQSKTAQLQAQAAAIQAQLAGINVNVDTASKQAANNVSNGTLPASSIASTTQSGKMIPPPSQAAA